MKKVIALIFISCALLLGSCHEDPPSPQMPTLPPITQEGANTFGCYVNGELWLAKGSLSNPAFTADYYDNCILISANRNGQDPFTYIHMDFGKVYRDTVFTIHNYTINPNYQYFVYSSGYIPSGPITDFYAVNLNSGEFHLSKLDTINRIISGTFNFVAVDTLSGDSVRITEGRFDLRY